MNLTKERYRARICCVVCNYMWTLIIKHPFVVKLYTRNFTDMYYIGRRHRSLCLVKVHIDTRSWSTVCELRVLDTYELSVFEWRLSGRVEIKGPFTQPVFCAIDILGRRTPSFYSEINYIIYWSKIISYSLNMKRFLHFTPMTISCKTE